MSDTLYHIADNLQKVIENGLVFDEETGEIYFDDSDIERLQVDVAKKAEAVVMYSAGRRALANAKKQAAKLMNESAKALETEADRLDSYAIKCVEMVGGKVETENVTVKVKKNPMSVCIINPDEIPVDYLVPKTTFDISKKAIKEDLMNGTNVPGACLVQNKRLEIK